MIAALTQTPGRTTARHHAKRRGSGPKPEQGAPSEQNLIECIADELIAGDGLTHRDALSQARRILEQAFAAIS